MSMDLEQVLNAVKNFYDGTPLKDICPLFLDEAPQGTTRPYCVYSYNGGSTDDEFDKTNDVFVLSFNFWSPDKSPVRVMQFGKIFMDNFDWTKFLNVSGSGHTVEYVKRLNPGTLIKDPDIGYDYVVNYEIRIQE